MALKRQITKAEHAALVPALQVEYVPDAGGETLTLQAIGFEDPAELRRARDREKARADTAEQKATEAQTKLEALGPDAQRKLADITTLENSWKTKLDTETGTLKKQLADRDKFIESALVDNVAQKIATDLAGANAAILVPHIKARLKVEQVEGGTPLTRVLDKDGKPSAASVTDLQNEFKTDNRFKVVVIASNGSGGGAAGGAGGNGGGAGAPTGKKFGELTDKERTDWYKSNPAEFMAASDAHRAEVLNRAPVRSGM